MDIKKIPPRVVPYMEVVAGLFHRYLHRSAGEYYGALSANPGTGVIVLAVDRMYAVPFLVLKTEKFDRIAITVTAAATGNAYLGIYKDAITKPGDLVVDAGTIDTGTTGDKELVIDVTLEPGFYWLSILANATPTVRGNGYTTNLIGLPGSISLGGNSYIYFNTQAYGTLPNPFPAINNAAGSGGPAICLRRA